MSKICINIDIHILSEYKGMFRYLIDNNMYDFNAHEIANIVWIFAKLNIKARNTQINQIVNILFEKFDITDMCNIIWSFAKLNMKVDSNGRIKQYIKMHANQFIKYHLKHVRWACDELKINISDIPKLNQMSVSELV